MKQIIQLNLEALAFGLEALLTEQLGGKFDVVVQKMERTKSTGFSETLLLDLKVTDHSSMDRFCESPQGKEIENIF